MNTLMMILIPMLTLFIGIGITYALMKFSTNGLVKKAQEEAEMIKQNKILEAKEKEMQMKADHEKVVQEHRRKYQQAQDKVAQQRAELQQQRSDLQQQRSDLQRSQNDLQRAKQELETEQQKIDNQKKSIEFRQQEVDKLHHQAEKQLETISGLSVEQAKQQLVDALKDEAKTNAMSYINDVMDEARLTANKEAKKIVIQTIQRVATEAAVENSVTVFHIENDEMKGRIIGREGRNIRALEAATGVEFVVDDTPEAIILSAFDPVRREIARLALHQLVTDGRIHPARIEEVVAKVQKQVEDEIIEAGKRTTIDLGIHGLHPQLVRLVGRMKYRSSYGQNLLQH